MTTNHKLYPFVLKESTKPICASTSFGFIDLITMTTD
nr:MAG TPA: hypothetical protein [Caudoviricetes sp.]